MTLQSRKNLQWLMKIITETILRDLNMALFRVRNTIIYERITLVYFHFIS